MWQWRITDFEAGQKLLDALALRVPAAPRAFLHQLIRKQRIHCDGQVLDTEQPVSGGMTVTILPSARFGELAGLGGIAPEELLFEDQHALVIYKPAGLAVHQAVGHDDNLTARAARFIACRHAPYRVAPIHRLDIGTSGPVLFGKGRRAASQYGLLLMDNRISKHYLALVSGHPPAQGALTTPIPEKTVSRPALTHYLRLSAAGSCALLELELVTGRRHQARRQLADAGWPIVGDRRYGGPIWPELDHPFLHCHRLRFPRLDDGVDRQVDCPLPEPLMKILASAGLTAPPVCDNHAESAAACAREQL